MNILIVEDHIIVNKGLQSILKEQFSVSELFFAKDSKSAQYHLASQSTIDLIITDLELDQGDWALDLVRFIRKKYPQIPIIIYSKYEEKAKLNDSLKAGAYAYVSKKDSEAVLKECIKRVLVNGRVISVTEQRINRLAEQVFEHSFMTPEEKFQRLSTREKEVARMMYSNTSRKKLAEKLFIGEETVKTHTRHIYEKLGIDSKAMLKVFFQFNPHLLGDE